MVHHSTRLALSEALAASDNPRLRDLVQLEVMTEGERDELHRLVVELHPNRSRAVRLLEVGPRVEEDAERVASLTAEGRSLREIARALGLPERTVSKHRARTGARGWRRGGRPRARGV